MPFLVASDPEERLAPPGEGGLLRAATSASGCSGSSIVTLCSWGRWAATGSLKVDESYPSQLAGTLLLAALAVGYGLLVLGWKGLLERPPDEPAAARVHRPRRGGADAADAEQRHLQRLRVRLGRRARPRRVHDRERAATRASGTLGSARVGRTPPASTARPPSSRCSRRASRGATRGSRSFSSGWTWFIPLALVMELSFRRLANRPFFHAMVWLNPLFLLEGPGQLHTDLLGVIAVTAGIVLQERGKLKSGWASYGLAILGKYSFALAGPWFWLAGARTTKERALRVPAIAAIVGVARRRASSRRSGAASRPSPSRSGRSRSMNPGGTLTEFAGHLVQLARGGRGRRLPTCRSPGDRARPRDPGDDLGRDVARPRRRRPRDRASGSCARCSGDRPTTSTIALGTGVLIVLVATLASRRFEPWYLMAALPFFGLRCPPVWRRWWVAVVAVSVAPDVHERAPADRVDPSRLVCRRRPWR